MERTLFFYLTFYPWTMIAAFLTLCISIFSEKKTHTFTHFWARSCVWLGGIKIVIRGTENIITDKPAIYVSNHMSNFDIPIIYSSLPIQFGWLAKKELFKVPLFGQAMRRLGCIPIDRSDRRKMMKSINAAAQQIKGGSSVLIFPEGTRSPDGKLHPFKKGALLIAAKAQVPVVPVAVQGSYQVLPKDRWKVTSGTVTITFLPPIVTDTLKTSAIDTLTTQAHDLIATTLQGATTDV